MYYLFLIILNVEISIFVAGKRHIIFFFYLSPCLMEAPIIQ